ncbi:hypothetical protein HK097_010267 [Rhizophlyctis rosea]|uniref:Ankyrin repeat protein n=1 Tax=Rhizophlyctis rosea TaxID=64517 RepID=A0AAD5SB16_9FUNG|nr:hypothetical protein HK097_010267 [Rhizophlyctis rosea]
MLLKAGASPENQHGCLGAAVEGRHVDIVRLLLEAGAEPNDSYALRACWEVDVLRLLIEAGADNSLIEKAALRDLVERREWGRPHG